MKIGILSMQQVVNVGSCLQAYGLKKTIEALGHEVEFIDIIIGAQLKEYEGGIIYAVKKALKRLKCSNPFVMAYYSLKSHKYLKSEINKILGLNHLCTNKSYDAVVIGSDEVWNFAQKTWFGFAPQLFGQMINAPVIISYAACCGAATSDIARNLGLTKELSFYLSKNFNAISVRDQNSRDFVRELTGINPAINIDPVLLYDFTNEVPNKKVHPDRPYMLIYTYPNRIKNKNEVKAIKAYAHKNNLKIISMTHYLDWVDEVAIISPFEVLAYFRDADCIVTDTFHGTIMSIKYNKQFATIVRSMNNNKLAGLLSQFSLKDREVKDINTLEEILNTQIDFSEINKIISKEQDKSIRYLSSNLGSN